MPRAKSSPSTGPKRVTLQDIARVANVHVMTVSDALNGRRAAPETQERVQRIAREMNYLPNFAAKALSTGRTGMIAVLSGGIYEAYHGALVHGLEKHLEADGYKVVLLPSPKEIAGLEGSTSNLAIDGAIVIDEYDARIRLEANPNLPLVAISPVARGNVDQVVVDVSGAMRIAIDTMITAGRRRIAYFVGSPELASPYSPRTQAYLSAMHDADLAPLIVSLNCKEITSMRESFAAFIAENGCPNAILCHNDDLAMRLFRVLRDLGLNVPEDVLLVGCNGQSAMEFFDPPLSTIAPPIDAVAFMAWWLLQRRMANPTATIGTLTLRGKLCLRESLGVK